MRNFSPIKRYIELILCRNGQLSEHSQSLYGRLGVPTILLPSCQQSAARVDPYFIASAIAQQARCIAVPTPLRQQTALLFLDVDGVLHRDTHVECQFEPQCIAHLKRVLQSTNARIVLSSDWRLRRKDLRIVESQLRDAGIMPIIDVTCFGRRPEGRWCEVLQWLRNWAQNQPVSSWICIDDNDFSSSAGFELVQPVLVQTDGCVGLDEATATQAINLMLAQVDGGKCAPFQL